METGWWADLMMDAIIWFVAVCLVSHSFLLVHLRMCSPTESIGVTHAYVG